LKIIHTADWHIGKVLHNLDLTEDHTLFFDWLTQYISDVSADVLLVSGDVFDHNNPTNEAQKLFCKALTQLQKTGVQIVITGGNHDSISRLESVEDLLRLVGIEIIGGVPDDFDQQIVPLKNRDGVIEVICAAVPYLRDKDTRPFVSGESFEDRIKAYQVGVLDHFTKLKDRIAELYPAYPIVAMGHLYMQGATMTDSVREIQIGNAAGLDVVSYQGLFDYFALGHIHIPLRYGSAIRYSGSPIQLDFTEGLYEKIVIEVDLTSSGVESHGVKVPLSRDYISFKGAWADVKSQLMNFTSDKPLSPVFNIDVAAHNDEKPFIHNEIDELLSMYKILQKKISPINAESKVLHYEKDIINKVKDLSPLDVFCKRLETYSYTEVSNEELLEAYQEILTTVYEKQ
jgi:exonuclease SbcD